MSILITTNITSTRYGFPINPVGSLEIVALASALASSNIGSDCFDQQDFSKEKWLEQLVRKRPKLLIVYVNEAYLTNLPLIKANLPDTKIVLVCKNQQLINTFIFEYQLDYVVWSENYKAVAKLVGALNNPFSPFYDHVEGIAYKNGAGTLTKTEVLSQEAGITVLNSNYCNPDLAYYLPIAYQFDGTKSIKLINPIDSKVITDLWNVRAKDEITSAYIKVPASKKALKEIMYLCEKVSDFSSLHIYPSCDVVEDEAFYQKMAKVAPLFASLKNANWLKKIVINFKIGRVL
jgi:hypothetical protein